MTGASDIILCSDKAIELEYIQKNIKKVISGNISKNKSAQKNNKSLSTIALAATNPFYINTGKKLMESLRKAFIINPYMFDFNDDGKIDNFEKIAMNDYCNERKYYSDYGKLHDLEKEALSIYNVAKNLDINNVGILDAFQNAIIGFYRCAQRIDNKYKKKPEDFMKTCTVSKSNKSLNQNPFNS